MEGPRRRLTDFSRSKKKCFSNVICKCPLMKSTMTTSRSAIAATDQTCFIQSLLGETWSSRCWAKCHPSNAYCWKRVSTIQRELLGTSVLRPAAAGQIHRQSSMHPWARASIQRVLLNETLSIQPLLAKTSPIQRIAKKSVDYPTRIAGHKRPPSGRCWANTSSIQHVFPGTSVHPARTSGRNNVRPAAAVHPTRIACQKRRPSSRCWAYESSI